MKQERQEGLEEDKEESNREGNIQQVSKSPPKSFIQVLLRSRNSWSPGKGGYRREEGDRKI